MDILIKSVKKPLDYISPYICIIDHNEPFTATSCSICRADIRQCAYCGSGMCKSCNRDKQIDTICQ